ncbi:MAG: triose-phosphate isomerase [Burkholderiales bacterium]
MRSTFVAGNWKMNGSLAVNAALLEAVLAEVSGIESGRVAVIPPFPYLSQCAVKLTGSPVAWGAQDVSEHGPGAHTGDVSAEMVADLGGRFVIVGHSERRAMHRESNELVARKAIKVTSIGLAPIMCVGETLQDRESSNTEAVIGRQLDALLDVAGVDVLKAGILAYEPVWAIGTGKTATPEQAQEVHAFIRARVRQRDGACAAGLRILYGGSVKGSNAAALFAMPDVDGGLVGGAALVASEFGQICRAALAVRMRD